MENNSFIKNDLLKEYLMVGENSEKEGHTVLDGVFQFC
jgi:hypothetical protein